MTPKQKEYQRQYYLLNRDRILTYHKQWANKNLELYNKKRRERQRSRYKNEPEFRERVLGKCSKWKNNNYEKRKQVNREYAKRNRRKQQLYTKNREESDLNFLLSRRIRCRIKSAIRNSHIKSKTKRLLGADIDLVRTYLESKFKPGMSWENYGYRGWHIDHVLPCASFDLTKPKEQKKCFRYTNLQPLWAEENFKKNRFLSY